MTQEALKLALEALEADELDMVDDGSGNMVFRKEQAITAIKEALAQPEQEPVAYLTKRKIGGTESLLRADMVDRSAKNQETHDFIPLYKEPKPCPTCEALARTVMLDQTSHDTTPPQRTWVGLTKEEIAEFDTWHDNREEETGWVNPSEIVAYIDAKLKERNT